MYFLGVGGIGMSALARYFNHTGISVEGYDLTRTSLTDKLMSEGIDISFDDDIRSVSAGFLRSGPGPDTLVVYTPAIPVVNKIFQYFKTREYRMVKRSELLGTLFNKGKGIAIAGTHGKTSVSVLISWLLSRTSERCNAFLGGVSKNFNSNLMVSEESRLIVAEADEYDRSFLQLKPDIAVITSIDPDHLDVYGNFDEMKRTFLEFARQVNPGGTIICRKGLDIESDSDITVLSYDLEGDTDYFTRNLKIGADGLPVFDLVTPSGEYKGFKLGIPGRFNVENAVAAIAVALICGVSEKEIREGLESFKGVYRRFDIQINTPECVYIDDYAHHPAELKACISSIREWFPGRRLMAIFQPHLFSRTRDFALEFAESLEEADDVILLDIYPAREEPIEGVSSDLIFDELNIKSKMLITREKLPEVIAGLKTDIVVTLGAGNIDAMVEPVKNVLTGKLKGIL
ncbi:MAG: UDP-N-acetylmuramate--L-alanine ligase [Bacteroidales bacterium]